MMTMIMNSMTRRRKDKNGGGNAGAATTTTSTISPWLSLVLLLVILGLMNYQSMMQLERVMEGNQQSSSGYYEQHHRMRRMSTNRLDQQSFLMKRHNKTKKASIVDKSSFTATTSTTTTSTNKKNEFHIPIPPRPANGAILKDLVKPGDYIYYQDAMHPRWDAAPIVIESHKLVFFTIPKVGCTVWKHLFRRMMGFTEDWQSQDYSRNIPHDPQTNGLKYLYDYNLTYASEIMTSPEWTRAIMVRDPKLRFLSAFLDKAVSNDHIHIQKRCCPDKSCIDEASGSIAGFLKLVQICDDEHWLGQHVRVDAKFWPYMDVVGHVETAATDARQLLERIGAWEEYGASGWGPDGTASMFQSKETDSAGEHATYSQWKTWQWYTPESEAAVERFYQADYLNPLFQFERNTCLTCVVEEEKKE